MQISDEGIRLIKSFESYKTKLPDGSCTAYQAKYKDSKGKVHLDIPTIGWGCTEGVKMGDVWTLEQAEAALKKEIAKFEAAVTRLVTVEINQNEFDALVSFSYNLGTGIGAKKGGLANSSILSKLNRGDRVGAAQAFHLYRIAYGGVQPGLVSRRAREASLFLKPVEQPVEPYMPQVVEAAKPPVSKTTVALGTVAVATVAQQAPVIPPVPEAVTQTISNFELWKTTGVAVWTLKAWAMAEPFLASGLAVSMGGFYLWSRKQQGAK